MTQQQITRNESINTATKITAIRTTVNPIISPFFQWVGGKRKFIYLNRYSFRGVYRVNKYNQVQMSYSTRKYCQSNNFATILNQCSNLLQNTLIYASDFSFIEPKANDFVYFDPPYHKSGETFYTRLPFGENDQVRLSNFAKELSNKGVKLMLSNSDTNFIRDLYKGFNISTITVKYSMSNYRKISNELLITNY